MYYLCLIAMISGAAISTQAAMNAHLGVLLRNPLLATCIAFCSSMLFTLLAIMLQGRELPSLAQLKSVPVYLWFGGGIFSAFGISMFYYLIPKLGMGLMLSFALTGQLLVAVIAGHYGWFDLPIKPVNPSKLAGIAALILGIFLINKE